MRRYVYIWEFEVRPEHRAAFVRHYGVDGTWARLFRRATGYLETLLLQDQNSPTRLVTIDRWASAEAHDAFMHAFRSEYDRIDALCEALTAGERSLGSYWELVPDPDSERGA